MIFYTLGTFPQAVYNLVVQKVLLYYDRRWSFKENITHTDLQSELDELNMPPRVVMEEKYAIVLVLIFVNMTFSSTMVSLTRNYLIASNEVYFSVTCISFELTDIVQILHFTEI
jgi:hypothetical protein